MEPEFSTFMDGENCQECVYYEKTISRMEKKIERLQETEELYNELLYGVGEKHQNETRHQTALRYIKNHSKRNISTDQAVSAHESIMREVKSKTSILQKIKDA